jgi:hypothetical protein
MGALLGRRRRIDLARYPRQIMLSTTAEAVPQLPARFNSFMRRVRFGLPCAPFLDRRFWSIPKWVSITTGLEAPSDS